MIGGNFPLFQSSLFLHSSTSSAGLVQCFANGDQATLDYIARRLEKLVAPFELRTAFSRQRFSQLLMIEGEPPAAAVRLEHADVAMIQTHAIKGMGREKTQGSH